MKFLPLLIFGFSLSISAPAQAAPSTTPTCTAGAGLGAIAGVSTNQAGHGCVVIKYNNGSADVYETFNYTGTDQSWTSPASTTTLTFYLVGAGGGAKNVASKGPGASGGFATGTYSATGSTVFKIIVGQGGNGTVNTVYTYGGGGKADYGSGGGRSAIRLSNATEDLITAGGGGGGGYDPKCGGAGGGTTGQDAVVRSGNGEHGKGATQTAGGVGGYSTNSLTGGTGVKYQGGLGQDESGGGGGGYWGGGGGGDNAGAGGGSGYFNPTLITSGVLVQGTCTATGSSSAFSFTITYDGNGNTSGTSPANATINAFTSPTLATNSGTLARTGYTFAGWNTRADGTGTSYTVGQTGFYPTTNRTLYAQWNSTITYNGNGQTSASNTVPPATTALGTAGNTTLATQGTLAKTGATFSGWNTAADGTGTRYAAGLTTYASTGSITLYAQWTLPTGTPTLSSSSDLGTSNSDKLTKDNTPDINVGTLVSGASVTLTATPASGSAVTCTFTASSTSETCTFPTLADGIYSITATQTYNGATSAVSTALANVQIDTVRPTVTLTSSAIVSGGNSLATPGALSNDYNITATFSEVVNGFVIGEITKNAESTGWAISTTALSTSALAAYTFNVINSTGAGNAAGKLYLSIAEGVASDAAGNTNAATTSSFIINTIIQLTLTNQYQAGITPVVGGNNATVVQTSNGASVDLTGQGGVTRANHTFAGWSLVTTNGSGAVIPSPYTPTVPLFLYSSWTPNVYVVTYDANGANGASTEATKNYTYGTAAIAITTKGTLTKTGYTFGGWNTLATGLGTNYLENASYTPTASITLYAKWTAGTYTVSFNGNSSTGGSTASLSITAGTAIALRANGFTRTGYTFASWNTAADGSGTSYAGAASVTLYADRALYAQWTVARPGAPTVSAATAGNTTATVTVTGASESGTTIGPATSYSIQTYASDGTTVITGKTCTVLDSASPKSCQITGLTNSTIYKFLATAINTTGSTAGSISTVTATPAPYVVTYSLNGGTLTAPDTSPVNYNLGTPLTLPLPSKTGYTFTGWNNPSSASVGLNGASYSPSATITLTAQWSALTYSVTYSGNGSNGGTVPSVGSFTYGYSYSIAEDGTMTKSGYTFAGWTTAANGTGTLYANAADSITSSTATYSGAANLTLYAKWTAQVYAITYDVNGATGAASKSSDSFTFGGTSLVLPTIGTMVKTNYTFGGWSETSSGVAVTSPYSPTQTRTLYAVWSGVQYSISYNTNGSSASVSDVLYTTGATGITLSDGAGVTREGYTFAGWKTSAGNTVTSPYVATSNITLYAFWTPISPAIIFTAGTINSAVPTVTLPSPNPTSAEFGSEFTLPAALSNVTDGGATYVFAGWSFNSNTYQAGSKYRMTTAAPIFAAQWLKLLAVRYVLNGGSLATDDQLYDAECTFAADYQCGGSNINITLNKAPTRTGFNFTGWVSQGAPSTLIIANTLYTLNDSNYIFYATWSPNTYRITYSAGTGSTSSAAPDQTGNYGDVITLASGGNYSLSGSVFTGWSITTSLGAGALYTLGTHAGTLNVGTGVYDLTATAQYANNTFKVFYNTNGGSSTPAATSAVSGASITLDAATSFTKAGYDFDGWSDGTQPPFAASYATTMGAANSTLIAQWKIKSPAAPTFSSVTGVDGGATVVVAPGSGGGSPTSYTVTSSPSGGSCTIYAPATSCSIAPLTNGTAYTFTVSATNSTGTTNGATSSSPVTPAGKPGPPTGVSAVRGNGQATVTFTAPTDTGGSAITSYTVTAYNSNGTAAGTCTGSGTTYTCTGLTNGSAYTFKATASNALSTSDLSTASSAVTPATVPGAPTSLAASSSSSGSATITFSAPSSNGGSSITGYTVTSSPAGATCTGSGTTYTCTGLTDGTAYTFTAVATNEVGNSIASTANSPALTTQGAASAPSTISATAGDSQATVTFSGAVANGATITSYTVQAYDSSGSAVSGATCTATTSATNGSCIVTGLTNGSSYTFKAITNSTANSSATSSTSSSASTAVIPAKVPDAPTSIAVTAGTGKVTVTWDVPSSNGSAILSYTVRAYDAAGSAVSGATCTATAPSTTCDVSSNLVAGTNYTFKVTATSAIGTSSASSASSATSINAAPSAPPNVTAVASNASATASWDAPVNINGSAVTGYTATAYDSSNNARGTCTTGASTLTCTVTGLTNGSPYTFKVTATNGIGTSSQSTASSAVTPSTVPNPPTNVTAAAGDAAATISFLAPTNTGGSDILSYTVTSSPGAATCTVNAPTRSCTLAGLTNGTAYTFTVIVTNANGNSVASSASASVTPLQSSAPTLASLTNQPLGNPYVGSTLTSNMSFNGSPTPTITYQWKVCESATDLASCTNLAGATSSTYVPTISELGKYIAVTATAANGISPNASETSVPTLVINPEIIFTAPTGTQSGTVGTALIISLSGAGGVGTLTYTVSSGSLPAGVTLDPATGQIAGTPTTAGTYTFTLRATDSNGVYKEVVVTITVAAATTPSSSGGGGGTPAPSVDPTPQTVTCDSSCQAAKDAAATKAAADKAAAEAIAKAAADKAAAEAAAAAKTQSDTAATTASTKAAADAAAAAAAAKAAIDKAAAAAVAQAAADAAAKAAAAQAKAASDAQAAATKAAADAAAALKNSTTTAAAKAAATKSANDAATAATAAVKAAATAAKEAATAKTSATNANKQVDIAINSLTSKTAASQASAQANAIAAVAKTAANEAAAAAATRAAEAKAVATAAQKAAADTAARIAIEQKQAADAAALAKIAADAAAKATAEKVAAIAAATKATEDLAKVLADKAVLADQAAKERDQVARAAIQKKIDEVSTKVEEVQKTVESATTKADAAVAAQVSAVQAAEVAVKEAQTQATEAIDVKTESVVKTTEATKAVAAATVATKVAEAAKAAAAKVPAKATIIPKANTSTSKNSATATVTGLKPGQKVKVTVNVKDK